jgi:plasmid stabilization system protein ParE
MRLIWLDQSRDDLQRLYDFLLDKDPLAAKRAVQVIREGAKQLLRFPEIGRRMNDDTERRELIVPFGAGAYVLRYRRRDGEEIVVLRVWHSRELRE